MPEEGFRFPDFGQIPLGVEINDDWREHLGRQNAGSRKTQD